MSQENSIGNPPYEVEIDLSMIPLKKADNYFVANLVYRIAELKRLLKSESFIKRSVAHEFGLQESDIKIYHNA